MRLPPSLPICADTKETKTKVSRGLRGKEESLQKKSGPQLSKGQKKGKKSTRGSLILREPSTATLGLDRYSNVARPPPQLAKVGLRGEDSRAEINELHLGLRSVEHGSGIFLAELYIC